MRSAASHLLASSGAPSSLQLVARFARGFSLAEFTSSALAEQQIRVACVLERLPIVMPDLPEWEAEYRQWAYQRKLDQAFYKAYPSKEKRGSGDGKPAAGTEEEDADKKTYQPVPSTTAADESGDTRTMKRRLKERVFLLVKTPQGTWGFPQAAHAGGETVRETAARALQEAIGNEPRLHFIGNAPMAHVQPASGGSPLFFLLSQVLQDPWPVRLQPGAASDHAWVTKSELRSYLTDAEYCSVAEQML